MDLVATSGVFRQLKSPSRHQLASSDSYRLVGCLFAWGESREGSFGIISKDEMLFDNSFKWEIRFRIPALYRTPSCKGGRSILTTHTL